VEIAYCQNCNNMIGPRESAGAQSPDGKILCNTCAASKASPAQKTQRASGAIARPVTGQNHRPPSGSNSRPPSSPNPVARKTTGSLPTQSSGGDAPLIQSGAMKFYFCETCGKRVTDLDIQKGAGRDKKLKGVYCQSCAVGVTTMVDMPIIGDAPSDGRPPKSGGFAVRNRKMSDRESDDNLLPPPVASRPFPLAMVALCGSGAVVLGVVMFFVVGRKNGNAAMTAVPQPPVIVAAKHAPNPEPLKSTPAESLNVKIPEKSDPDDNGGTPAAFDPVSVAPLPSPEKLPEQKQNAGTKPIEPAKVPVAVPSEPATSTTTGKNPAGVVEAELISKVIRLLGQHQLTEAVAIVRDARDPGDAWKQELILALGAAQKEEQDFRDQLATFVGKPVTVQTAKESVEGKLVAVDFPLLKIEKSIAINGESIGSTVVSLSAYDLNDTSRLTFYRPGDTDGAGWAGRTLSCMASSRLSEAESALSHLKESLLKDGLSVELKRTKVLDTEAQALAAWTSIQNRAKETPTQSRAKQLLADLAAFEKTFGSTEFVSSPGVSTPLKELRAKMERLSTGLDPRVLSLFKGRVAAYDGQTSVMTLEYDFSAKEQTEDFTDPIWAPPGDHTGMTWAKGKLSTFCKDSLDILFSMPQFVSNTVNIQFDYQNLHGSYGNAVIDCGFYAAKSTVKSPKVRIDWNAKTCSIVSDATALKSVPSTLGSTKQGKVEISYLDKTVTVKLNGATIVEHVLPKPNEHAGFWIGGGWDSGMTITKLQVSGRLDQNWLANALKAAK
jgi:DNA-directed RNA polymerase subunit RPC12/RpoP